MVELKWKEVKNTIFLLFFIPTEYTESNNNNNLKNKEFFNKAISLYFF